ncbi:cobyrinic acid a,c-diamide synthase [Amycolatopsis antarctica]|uniref:Cobyrinic acid a,c-diamide synthase n=1 Tax=Amycolatopsis antarctica TaxID=1854586 RepID=A0A263CXN1_9PSEU|nr:cobyrinic acid a,c-diamide synthase [Amycolatopsis antarctica]OZM70861.1 cobyrinic acid a,c-diamide synthase [Amycolatopsis antarctica]
MSRRASLPGASELFFRRTSGSTDPLSNLDEAAGANGGSGAREAEPAQRRLSSGAAARPGSGRQKHDAKITVYVSGDELLAMEQARLNLRAKHDLVVDRGRLVREAVAVLLGDFEAHGEDSVLVQRLRADAADAEEADG